MEMFATGSVVIVRQASREVSVWKPPKRPSLQISHALRGMHGTGGIVLAGVAASKGVIL